MAKSRMNRVDTDGPKSVIPLLGSYAEFKANLNIIKCRLTPSLEVSASQGACARSKGFIIDPVQFAQSGDSPLSQIPSPELTLNIPACV